jgi:putative Holliday junction resolvase
MKLLGIDYGRRRIGVAVTSELGIGVRSVGTVVHNGTHQDALEKIMPYICAEEPSEIVFGVPLDSYDNETTMSAEVRAFAACVSDKTSLPVHFIDESYSSVDAQKILANRPKKQRRDKKNIDRIAACLILDSFLQERM